MKRVTTSPEQIKIPTQSKSGTTVLWKMANKRTYEFGKSHLTLEFGDITTSQAQVLVSSDDYYLSMGGGVSASILRAGGNAIALDAAKKVPAALGDVVVTTAGSLPAQYIFHVITRGHEDSTLSSKEIIRQATKHCVQMLDTLHLNSIAFPAIGAGAAGFEYGDVAIEMADVITEDLNKRTAPLDVTIYLFDRFGQRNDLDFIEFFEQFASRIPRLADKTGTEKDLKDTVPVAEDIKPSDAAAETDDQIRMRRLNNVRKLIGSLEDRRFELEARLIEIVNTGDDREKGTLQKRLDENQELRLDYLNELKALSQKDFVPSTTTGKQALSVFVSSTYKDLVDHRASVKDQVMRRDMLFRGMETFGADPNRVTPATKIVEEVRKADVYLGIFGVRYGYIDSATGLSMTELEFNEAIASGKRMVLYVIRDDAPVKVSDIEPDPSGKAKLDNLRRRILAEHTVYLFDTADDLARQVYEDLGKL
jgi:O-acetyl-ADP-ribose deacetylase (regulator of RNase III)